jgi:hypothetical protein
MKRAFWFLVCLIVADAGWAQWSPPVRLQGPINSDPSPKSWPSINATEDTIYYAKIGVNLQENICYSYRYNDSLWSAPIFMPDYINSPDQRDLSPSIGPGDSTLYWVTYDRVGGYGSYDIWFTRRGVEGQWGQPENAGPNVNTASMEWGVFFSRSAQHLYLSSTRPGGYGFLDIWKSDWNGTGWGPATNMGLPINTYLGDEENVTLPADESYLIETAAIYSATLRDLYIFYSADSGWSQREAIPEFTSPENETGASLAPDGRTIYFSSARNDTNNYRNEIFISHRTDTLKVGFPRDTYPRRVGVFPNPYRGGLLRLQLDQQLSRGQLSVSLYDLLGRRVLPDLSLIGKRSDCVPWRLQELPAGTYFVSLVGIRDTKVIPLIILK